MVRYALPIMLITALVNPAFNHRGMMIICCLPMGNPLTFESIIYGLAAAVTPVSVLPLISGIRPHSKSGQTHV